MKPSPTEETESEQDIEMCNSIVADDVDDEKKSSGGHKKTVSFHSDQLLDEQINDPGNYKDATSEVCGGDDQQEGKEVEPRKENKGIYLAGKNGREYTMREFTFVFAVGVLLSFNSGYINGSCLSGLLTESGTRQSVAGFTGAYTNSAGEFAGGEFVLFGFHVKMILSFIFGAFIAGAITPRPVAFQIGPTYGPTFLIGCAFLTTASVLSALKIGDHFVFYCAAASNGIQNGMTSLYSANLIRSSHLTGTSTDIGLFVGQYLRGNKDNLWKLKVLVSFALSFWGGGVVSFFATSKFTKWSLLFNAALFLLIGLGLIIFLVTELHISVYAALFGDWKWKVAINKLNALSSTRNMSHVFDRIDIDGDGHIDREELIAALAEVGITLSEVDKKAMFKVADVDNDGEISRAEWRNVVKACN